MGEPDLPAVAGPLYALPLTEFVAARAAAAKGVLAAGPATDELRSLAAAVRSLAKPSVAAWAVNMLAAYHPGILQELASLGASMRAAQSSMDAAALRSLGQQRKRLLSSALETVRTVTEQQGRRISGPAAAEVEQTLRALTADQGAADAVRSGLLLRALTADGLDAVDLLGALAVPGSPAAGRESGRPAGQPLLRAVQPAPRAHAPAARERAAAGLKAAEQAARAAAQTADQRGQDLADAAARVTRLADEVRTLQEALTRTGDELKQARKEHSLAEAEAARSVRAAGLARRQEVLATERVLRLGNTPEQ
ncbi:hypothetical protein [Arthrobacter oryzae]|uniref:hypothetical protein n=1 Tax=Arthrobacter oryzae TaxID=409290 RepID=UPI0011CE57CD|nr:hypothetical protein [Arthrobacter oryzae]